MSTQMLEQPSQTQNTNSPIDSIDDLLAQADNHVNQSQFDEAKSLYLQVCSFQPHHAHANYGLGIIEANTSNLIAALQYFEAAVKSQPNNEQYWVSYIDALLLSNQFDKAKAVINLGQNHGLSDAFASQLLSECEQGTNQSLNNNVQNAGTEEPQYTDFHQALSAMLTLNILQAEEHQAQKASGDASAKLSADVDFSPIAPFFNQWFSGGHYQEILTIIEAVITRLVQTPELVGHKIYTSFFDKLLAQFDYKIEDVIPRTQKSSNIIVASELYNYGGHTKEIATLLHNLENPILIVTDIYNSFAVSKTFETIAEIFPDCPVLTLPQEASLAKSRRLAKLINQLAKNVYLLVHHNDSTAVAACQQSFDVNYYFVHHADHNAALGNYSPHFNHVDLFADRAQNCAEDLDKKTYLLPTTTTDLGVKTFSPIQETCATVTAGSFGKFKTEGSISLSKLIIKSIEITNSAHYHFGTIPNEELAKIKQDLVNAGVDLNQFVYQNTVPSLWESLKEIDAHIFIGSAPVMGAKSDIEAQGAGYPLLAFKALNCPRHLNVGSHAPETTYWHDIESFVDGLNAIKNNHSKLSTASRAFYLNGCAPEHYQRGLAMISE